MIKSHLNEGRKNSSIFLGKLCCSLIVIDVKRELLRSKESCSLVLWLLESVRNASHFYINGVLLLQFGRQIHFFNTCVIQVSSLLGYQKSVFESDSLMTMLFMCCYSQQCKGWLYISLHLQIGCVNQKISSVSCEGVMSKVSCHYSFNRKNQK